VKDLLRWTIVLAATMPAYGAHADINSWASIGLNGGRVFRVAYNPSNPSIVYLLSQGGFARSTDGGVTWKLIYTDLQQAPYDMAVDPSNPNNVYVVSQTEPYFMASSDGGKTMAPVNRPPIPTNFAGPWSVQVSADGKTIYVASGPYITASTDRGKSWAMKTGLTYLFMNRLFADPKDPLTLYAEVDAYPGGGLYVSHDGALTWTVSNWSTTDEYNYTNDLAIDPSNTNTLWNARANGLWVSRDRGVTWSLTSYDIPAFQDASMQVSAVAVDPHNSSIIYASNGWGETLRSVDGGVSWFDVTGNITNQGTNVIAINPTNNASVLIGGLGGVWGTATAGTNWTQQVEGLAATYVEHFSANAATDRIYMNTEDSLIGYIANGDSRVSLTNRDTLRQLTPGPGSFVVSSIVTQEGSDGKLFAALIGGVAASPDGGTSWTMNPIPYLYGTMMQYMATWPGSQTLLVAGIAAQFRSTDAGFTWSPVTAGLPTDTQFNKLVTAPSDPDVAYVSVYGSLVIGPTPYYDLYKSVDAGLTWQRAGSDWPSKIYQIAVDPFDAQTVYATTEDRFLKSTTGGKTFSDMPWDSSLHGHVPALVTIDPVHNQILYGVSGQGVIRSVDSGQTWQVLPGSPFSPTYGWSITDITVDPNRTSDVYVGTMRNGGYKLTVSPDLAVSLKSAAKQSGSTLTRTYAVANEGPYDATGAKLIVQLPAGATKVSGSVDTGACTSAANTLTCTLPVLRSGASHSAVVSAVVPGGGDSSTTATLSADQPDADASNNSVVTTTQVAGTADLSVKASGPTTAKAGDSVSYTLTVLNAGPDAAVSAHLNYQPDANIKMADVSATSGACSSTDAGMISCDLGDIAVSKSVTVTVNAVAMVAGTSNATASVTSLAFDPDATNSSAASSTSISGPDGQSGGGAQNASSSGSSAGASSSGGGGSGGGGAFSAPWLLALALLLLSMKMLPPCGDRAWARFHERCPNGYGRRVGLAD
jgi:uncharacterized repeat protein (TIGR01451 family)